MKTLVIIGIILTVLFIYFVVKAEKSFVIRGDEVVPSGIDIPKLILNKISGGIKSQISSDNTVGGSGQGLTSNIITGAKDLISKTVDKINESVKNPIENKINEVFCPSK